VTGDGKSIATATRAWDSGAMPKFQRRSFHQDEWEQIALRLGAAQEDRRRRLAGQEQFVAELEALLFQHDPIRLNFEDNTDEYRGEAERITLRLPYAQSVDDVQRIVHEVFVHCFDPQMAGPESRYSDIAEAVWHAWTSPRATPS